MQGSRQSGFTEQQDLTEKIHNQNPIMKSDSLKLLLDDVKIKIAVIILVLFILYIIIGMIVPFVHMKTVSKERNYHIYFRYQRRK